MLYSSLSTFADSTSGIGALGIDWRAFVIQLVSFLLAFWVLKRFAFTPIVRVMEQRRATIESGVTLGEEMKQKQAELDQTVDATLQQARRDADAILAQAKEDAREAGAAIEAKTQKKIDDMLAAAHDQIRQDTMRARQALEGELVELISDATEAIIEEKVDTRKDASLLQKALKGSE